MFEESEWRDAADPLPAAPPRPAPPPRPRPRRHLLATLRRLQGLARSAPEGDPEQRPGGKRLRRGPDPAGRAKPRGGAPPPASPGAPLPSPAVSRGPPGPGPGGRPPGPRPPHRLSAAGAAGEKQQRAPPEEAPARTLTRRQWRNRQKNKRRQKNKLKAREPPSPPPPPPPEDPPALSDPPAEKPAGDRAESLRLRMEERLDGARFRYLNQLLYSCSSQEAAGLSREDPEAFAVYHRGFARQVSRWPQSPVQRLVRYLRHRPASLVVADFGCGDCTLARSVRNKVHCFDLVALDPRVTVCDMAQVPLEAESVDVAVFCLALMATNLREILEEANRVLRLGGTLLVAEVSSRFQDVWAFLGALAQLGFRLLAKDLSGSHFYTFELRKAAAVPAERLPRKPLPGLALRPCLYKRR